MSHIINTQPATRQELYDRVRASSLQEVILEEMVRYGYWPKEGEIPEDPAEDIKREGELVRELGKLRSELEKLHDMEKLIKAARRKRMLESRERQKENRLRRIREREERAAAWKERKQHEILYLGEGHSGTLSSQVSDEERLAAHHLPIFHTPEDLALAMGLSIGALRFLCFSRKVSKTSHYQRFYLPKKSGGKRLISAPMQRLKSAQHWLLEHVLEQVAIHPSAHGFRKEHSIVTNAEAHVGAHVVVNIDIENFFPTFHYPRVWGCFRALGYSPAVSTCMTLLCTEPEILEIELDGELWFVQQGSRALPQGAPTSPTLTNILCRRLDKRLAGLARVHEFTYSRYADDMTFSGNDNVDVGKLLASLRSVLHQEGLKIHPNKTAVYRRGRRREVTGIVVNEKLSVSRKTLRRFRATLFQIEKDGPEGKTWGNGGDLFASIQGYANFVHMVDPEKGRAFLQRVQRIINLHSR
tara:strand:- start:3018 stop:4427 length:1410 start_codon:yes stop_codon:yes gene_type:complete